MVPDLTTVGSIATLSFNCYSHYSTLSVQLTTKLGKKYADN